MTITTKFNVGDKVFTIDPNTMKVKELEVASILTTTGANGMTSVTLYAKDDVYSSSGYEEGKCFSSEGDLVAFITTKDDAEAL